MIRTAARTAVLLLLAACGSATAPGYYRLPDSAFRQPESSAAPTAVQVVLAEHLQGSGMVYQTDAHHLNLSQQNLWAEPLAEPLAASISNKLNRVGSGTFIPQQLAGSNGRNVLKIYIDRFQGSYTGQTEINGYAQWPDGRRQSLHALTPQHGDGYAAMLESLDKGLDETAAQIIRRRF